MKHICAKCGKEAILRNGFVCAECKREHRIANGKPNATDNLHIELAALKAENKALITEADENAGLAMGAKMLCDEQRKRAEAAEKKNAVLERALLKCVCPNCPDLGTSKCMCNYGIMSFLKHTQQAEAELKEGK